MVGENAKVGNTASSMLPFTTVNALIMVIQNDHTLIEALVSGLSMWQCTFAPVPVEEFGAKINLFGKSFRCSTVSVGKKFFLSLFDKRFVE